MIMERDQKSPLSASGLSLFFSLVYMVSYITRINYGAVIAEIEASTGLPRTLLSMAVTASFISYGAGQVLSGAMHGVNLMLVSMVPPLIGGKDRVSSISGLINACTYIGSAVSSYGIALLSGTIGWKSTVLIWILIAVLGTLICFGTCSAFRRKYM